MAKTKSGLGRDFYSLLDDNVLASDKTSAATMLRLSDIEPRKDQPRKNFEQQPLEQLADSIGQFGVLQPIVVRESPLLQGTYEILAGERRWRAAKMAGLNEIPAVVLDGDDLKAAQVAVIENVQREDLNPIEEALAYETLIDRFGLTQEQVADRVSKSRPAVANAMRLLSLPDELLSMVESGKLTAGHARALLSIKAERQQLAVAQKVVNLQLSVRQTEAMCKKLLKAVKAPEPKPVEVDYLAECEKTLTRCLGRGVKIVAGKRKGKIELEYYGQEDLQRLYEALSGSLGKEQP